MRLGRSRRRHPIRHARPVDASESGGQSLSRAMRAYSATSATSANRTSTKYARPRASSRRRVPPTRAPGERVYSAQSEVVVDVCAWTRLLRASPSRASFTLLLRASPSPPPRAPLHIPRHLRGFVPRPHYRRAQWRLGARRHLRRWRTWPLLLGLRARHRLRGLRGARRPLAGARRPPRHSAAALDGGAALQVTMVDADFGKKGRWAPEEGAPVALSHLHGTVLRVADRVDVSGWDGALPRQRPTFNLSAAGAVARPSPSHRRRRRRLESPLLRVTAIARARGALPTASASTRRTARCAAGAGGPRLRARLARGGGRRERQRRQHARGTGGGGTSTSDGRRWRSLDNALRPGSVGSAAHGDYLYDLRFARANSRTCPPRARAPAPAVALVPTPAQPDTPDPRFRAPSFVRARDVTDRAGKTTRLIVTVAPAPLARAGGSRARRVSWRTRSEH